MTKNPKRPAVFIDRDGTINVDAGYLADPDELKIFPWSGRAISLINKADMPAIVITNQSGVARGLCTEADLDAIHHRLRSELSKSDAHVDAIYYCPHHPEIGEPPYRYACDCRKPGNGLVLRAAREYNIDLASSYMIGDKVVDLELALRSGMHPVLVLTGYGRISQTRIDALGIEPAFVCENLLEAVERIVTR